MGTLGVVRFLLFIATSMRHKRSCARRAQFVGARRTRTAILRVFLSRIGIAGPPVFLEQAQLSY